MSEQVANGGQSIEYASFNRRLIASTIDSVILIILISIAMYPFNTFVFGDNNPFMLVKEIAEQTGVNLSEIESNAVDQARLQEALVKYHFYVKIMIGQVISLFLFGFFFI